MKLAKTFEGTELPKEVDLSLRSIYAGLVDELVEEYDARLNANEKHLSAEDKDRLRKYLRYDIVVRLSVSASITEKKLEDWQINPISTYQQIFAMSEEDQV